MAKTDQTDDIAAIRALVGAHFDSMRWDAGTSCDWGPFRADFLPGATLYPAARPVQPKTVDAFIERMNHVADTVLDSFEEATTASRIMVFGTVAVAMGHSRMLENGEEENEDVSAYLLVKEGGEWKIAAHAWDKVTDDRPPPDWLVGPE